MHGLSLELSPSWWLTFHPSAYFYQSGPYLLVFFSLAGSAEVVYLQISPELASDGSK